MFYVILILLTLLNKNLASQIPKACPTVSSNYYNVQWPNTSNWTLSDPPCVGKNKELLYRKCLDGDWEDEPECDYIQVHTPSKCPDDFIESHEYNLCYKISDEKTKFPPSCLYKDILPFESYQNLMDNNGPFWMPVVRNLDNGLGLLQWVETSSLYKTDFEGKYHYNGAIKDKNCLLYYNNSYIEAVACDEEHLSVCAYEKFDRIVDYLCHSEDMCVRSDFIDKTKCFCKVSEESTYPKAEFLELYQNNVIRTLTNETCSIGLELLNDTYIWRNSNRGINYTFWSTDAVFGCTHIYGALTPSGWILTENVSTCSLVEKDINVEYMKPELFLSYNSIESDMISVTVSFPQTLKKIDSGIFLYCFTDASAHSLIYRYDLMNDQNEYEFEPLGDGYGNYWCESFDPVDMKIIKSEILFVDDPADDMFEFVTILRIGYSEDINPLSKEMINFIEDNLFAKLYQNEHLKKSYILRIMKLVDVDESRRKVTVNFHMSTRNVDAQLHDEEYYLVKDIITEVSESEIISFSSSLFCMNETNIINWPKTGAGSSATSEEYCFKSDGTLMTRWCLNDFMNGAQWETINETCEIFNNFSSLTQDILNLETTPALEAFLDIAKRYQQFHALDVYLFGKKFQEIYLDLTDNDLEMYCEIIDYLMEIDRSTLVESQSKMRATDCIVEAIYFFFQKFKGRTGKSRICKKNFFYDQIDSIQTIKRVAKLSIRKSFNGDPCSSGIITLTLDEDSESPEEHLESEISLTPQILDSFTDDSPVVFLVFFKDLFFTTKTLDTETSVVGKVYRVIVQNVPFGESLADSFEFLQNSELNIQFNCSSWDFGRQKRGYWKGNSVSENSNLFQKCMFLETPYFALTKTVESFTDNVTESLIEVLESNSSTSETMMRLEKISKRYLEFVYIDVYLIGKILEKVHEEAEAIALELLAAIIDNLHNVQRRILQESQIHKKATDTVLFYIDRILINHKNQSQVDAIITNNFIISIYDTKDINFTGVALMEQNEIVQVQVLEGDIDVEEVSSYKNLESALVLSPELKEQLAQDSRIIITFFLSDALFNEREPKSKNVAKIFGAILPDIGKYSGPVSILQKVTRNRNQKQCVHWNYSTNMSGSWFKDENGKELASLVECDFWHTTHFSVLLVDEDKYQKDQVLDWITNINCFLSFLGLFCVFLTAFVSRKWRQNSGNKILLNFSFSIVLQLLLLYISSSIGRSLSTFLCTIAGMFLHYSVISEFCWMVVIAYLQYRRFVTVLGGPPQRVLLKSCLFGWIFPVFPTIGSSLLNNFDYSTNKIGICYPSGLGLLLGVWLPISLAVLFNFLIFVSIIYSVCHKKAECGNTAKNEMLFQWRIAFLLFFMLGITWIFGFLSELGFGHIFIYMFSITATLQGFVVFLFFIVLNINIKDMYWQNVKKYCHKDC